jgi:thiamine-phosphate pyrophosphorylase
MRRYYVTDRTRGDVVASARKAVADGVEMIQVREKDMAAGDLVTLVRTVVEIARGTSTRVLVNDRLDVALAAGADGLHLPADGFPLTDVRSRIGLVGVSTHSVAEAIAAEEAAADFVVFGPVFPTPGKTPVGLGELKRVVDAVGIPVFAIGGITAENAWQAIGAGAGGIAGIRMFQVERYASTNDFIDTDGS